MYKDVHLWRGGSAITSAPFVLCSSNFCSAAEKRYADITEKAHFYDAQGETSPFKQTIPLSESLRSLRLCGNIKNTFASMTVFYQPCRGILSFSHVLCYTPQSYEYGKFESWAGEGGQYD